MTKAVRSAVAKRSVVIGGHKTSVSLEEPFWNAVREHRRSQSGERFPSLAEDRR